ncbi:hypothetical protein JCQ34_08420 [Pseudarthrobacter defluvii]|nr:hypothetical protein JCQ34_08420 [Pseudarthrobacter defluvii]
MGHLALAAIGHDGPICIEWEDAGMDASTTPQTRLPRRDRRPSFTPPTQ